ncbi:dTDP-4-dehydrorhamnose reductase [Conchiformibius kuhniae]|uniref:dTDP-4-dehydrorhamnose reductase n=1 Tax=Conchiformibius kuhniae TaxID=211502 RepID=A0ABD8B7I6_9NEIS|nr:dTDP-4-dehydrorhamnose reductase [Conchiformibius kuhniae]
MMRVWLTGANGQIGRLTALALHGRAALTATARRDTDIRDRAAVLRTAAAVRPHVIINTAAHTDVDAAERRPAAAFAVNAHGAAHLAEAAHAVGATLLHLSTDYVFDGQKNAPYREDDPPNPVNHYGASKLAGEQHIIRHCPRHLILRTAWVFGGHTRHFVRTILDKARTHGGADIVADRFGAPTFADDLAAVLADLAQRAAANPDTLPYGTYHYCGAPHTHWHDFARHACRHALRHGLLSKPPELRPVRAADYPTPAPRPPHSRLDCGKITRTFGIAPSDWQNALARLPDWISRT